MHPQCWRQCVTHCAISARGNPDPDRAGLSFDARECLQVQCPTCRSSVTGEIDLSDSSGGRPVRVEQLERLVIPGSEPGDSLTFVPRMPRVSFPGHADREDGRLRAPTDGAGAAGGSGRRVAAPPSQAPAPFEPARARPPQTVQDDPGGPGYAMARVPAADGGRTVYEGGRNDVGSPAATGRDGRGDRGANVRHGGSMQGPGRAAACRVLDGRTSEVPRGPWCASSSRRGSRATARPRSGRW